MRALLSTNFDGPAVEVKDGIIASAWNLVHRSLTFAEFSSLSGIVPSTAYIKDYVELADRKNIEVGCVWLVGTTRKGVFVPAFYHPKGVFGSVWVRLAVGITAPKGAFVSMVNSPIVIQVKRKQLNLEVRTERMIFNIDSAMKHSYSNDDTCFSIDVIDEILEEDFDALLDKEPSFLSVIISSQLSKEKKNKLVSILKKHKEAFAWKTTDIPGICPSFCKHKIQLLDDKKPVIQKQRRFNLNKQEVVKKEIMKLLDTGIIYPIPDSPWVSPIHCVPKKGGITVVTNENDELVPTRTVTGWRVCIDYHKLNEATAKYHFPLPFMDQML
ncbi:hypothetical protein Tco_0252602 [Tanacetum coccineum]